MKEENELFDMIQEKKIIPLSEQVADKINQLIIDSNLKAGEKLPNEFELATQLNVGRGTIREAIKLLVARNCLEIKRGRGTFVAEHTGEMKDPLGLSYLSDQMLLGLELIEIRGHLEPWVAALAAERANETDIKKLREICDEVTEMIRRKENHLKMDQQFHICIANCTHNRVMPKLIPIITYSISVSGTLNKLKYREETIRTHENIVEAISRHDTAAAAQAMKEHIDGNKEGLVLLQKQLEEHK